MDPLIPASMDPALVRVYEKRGQERDREQSRRRAPPPELISEDENDHGEQGAGEREKHEFDDLA